MPTKKTKPARKPAKKAALRKPAARKPKAKKIQPLDLSAFPSESVNVFERWICLACVCDVFTRHLDISPRTAHLEIKRYTPSIAELYAPVTARPWFLNQPVQKFCPYCGSAPKWHIRLS